MRKSRTGAKENSNSNSDVEVGRGGIFKFWGLAVLGMVAVDVFPTPKLKYRYLQTTGEIEILNINQSATPEAKKKRRRKEATAKVFTHLFPFKCSL